MLLGAAVYRRGGGLLPGAAVYRWVRLLPLGAVACRRMQQLIAGCGGLPLGAAGHCRVRPLIVG